MLRTLFKKLKQVQLPAIQCFESSLSRHLSTDDSAYLLVQQQVAQRNEVLMFHFTYRFREACGSSEIVPGICPLSISLPSTELWSRIAFFFLIVDVGPLSQRQHQHKQVHCVTTPDALKLQPFIWLWIFKLNIFHQKIKTWYFAADLIWFWIWWSRSRMVWMSPIEDICHFVVTPLTDSSRCTVQKWVLDVRWKKEGLSVI